MAFTMLLWIFVLPRLTDGPLAYQLVSDTTCKKYWWTNLLYIQNFYPTNLKETVSMKIGTFTCMLECVQSVNFFFSTGPWKIFTCLLIKLQNCSWDWLPAKYWRPKVIKISYSLSIDSLTLCSSTKQGLAVCKRLLG